jgi:hypothetical protein
MEIEINGVKYISKEQSKMPVSKTMMAVMIMAGMEGSLGGSTRKELVEDEFIVKEYSLIQQKKSNLSKRQRDYVVWKFKKTFKRVSD